MCNFKIIPADISETFRHENGRLLWLTHKLRPRIGSIACSQRPDGYRRVRFKGVMYAAHRVIFFLVHGRQPKEIGHRDGIVWNNRPSNLREGTHAQNGMNRKIHKNSTTGFTGVSWDKKAKKWSAKISKDGKRKHLGYFSDIQDAITAREAAEKEYFGQYSRAASIATSIEEGA